jgi:DNA-directed RNA polymerase subunit RPC12/RpoP
MTSNAHVSEESCWYFICDCCDAKLFALKQEADCPRCGQRIVSRERLPLPWWNYGKSADKKRPHGESA